MTVVSSLMPFAVIAPLLLAAILLPFSYLAPRRIADAASILCAGAVTALCAALTIEAAHHHILYWFGGWHPRGGVAIGIAFAPDAIGAGIATLAAFLVTLALAFSWWYFESAGTRFQVLMLIFLAAMVGFALTADIFNLFVFFELMSVAAFALTGYKIEEPQAIKGAINFAITNSCGAFMVLLGIAMLYGRTGALNLAQIAATVAHARPDGVLVIAFALIVCGFFVKGAIVPFHLWLDDAHAVAPTPLCILFSGVMVQLSIYAVARVYWSVFAAPFHGHAAILRDLLLAAGLVTALVGGIMAYSQSHVKRLLAFSTISHSGLFICGLAALSPLGIAATALFVVAHGTLKAALFMGSGVLLQKHGSVDLGTLHNRCRNMPWTAALFVVGGMALAGLPPFGTSLAKSLLDESAKVSGFGWAAFIFAIASLLDGAAVLRVAAVAFFGWGVREGNQQNTPREEERETKDGTRAIPPSMLVPAYIALGAALATGLIHPLALGAAHAASHFTHLAALVPVKGQTPSDIAEELSIVAAAIALALWRPALQTIRRAFAPLRAMHDGVFTDYMLWMLVGFAIYAGVLAPIAF